jgi:hypothetical protein
MWSGNIYIYILLLIGLLQCTTDIAGGGSDLPDKNVVVGSIFTADQYPAANTQVMLIPSDYNSLTDSSCDILIDTTDSKGSFHFSFEKNCSFNIQAVHITNRTRLLITDVKINDDSTTIPADTLQVPGTIKMFFPECIASSSSRIYLPGTTIASNSTSESFAILDSVPVGKLTRVSFLSQSDATLSIGQTNIIVLSSDTTVVINPQWRFSKTFILNTSTSGANVSGTVLDFPVLVRLNSGNFDFSQADVNGADIRFSKTDNTPISYEIEQWDAVNQKAEVWVKMDTVYGNNSTQSIIMLWGKTNTTSKSSCQSVFDTTCGFQGVWHLGETDSLAFDATANAYHGKVYNTKHVNGIIGSALQFDGLSSIIRMNGTGLQSKLNFPVDGQYTLSSWVYHEKLTDSATYLIAGKGELHYFLKCFDLRLSTAQKAHQWEFSEYHENDVWQVSSFSPATAGAWFYLTGVRDGPNEYLYVNGTLVMEGYKISGNKQGILPRDTTDDFTIGGFLHPVANWNQGYAYFNGIIDEVNISSIPRNADWIKLCYLNQKTDDILVKCK